MAPAIGGDTAQVAATLARPRGRDHRVRVCSRPTRLQAPGPSQRPPDRSPSAARLLELSAGMEAQGPRPPALARRGGLGLPGSLCAARARSAGAHEVRAAGPAPGASPPRPATACAPQVARGDSRHCFSNVEQLAFNSGLGHYGQGNCGFHVARAARGGGGVGHGATGARAGPAPGGAPGALAPRAGRAPGRRRPGPEGL